MDSFSVRTRFSSICVDSDVKMPAGFVAEKCCVDAVVSVVKLALFHIQFTY